MKKSNIFFVLLATAILFVMAGCGIIFPNVATIVVENDASGGYIQSGVTVDEDIEYKDMYIHGAGIETDKLDVKDGKKVAFQLTWFGDRADFKLNSDYAHTTSIGGVSSSADQDDITLAYIQDVGNGDIILVKFEVNSGTQSVEISKDYRYKDSDIEERANSLKQD